ncbi:MAG: SurA N-terminal domain-containing protein [Deltaproteobacteria bacterium]|nr:SurA N-terminal domain-containing protein [Deltaproteobacteria bacterium]
MTRLLLILLALVVSVSTALARVVDGVAAVVDGQVITRSDVDDLVGTRGPQEGVPGARDRGADALDSLIEKALVEKEAARLGVSVTDEDVENSLGEIRKRNNLDDKGFRSALASQGLDYDVYVRELRAQILRVKLAGLVLRPRIRTDEEAIKEYYLKHVSDFCEPPKVRLGHLQAADRQAAEGARARLAAGEAPDAVAKDLPGSKGYQDMGLLDVGSLSEAVRAAIQGVGPGGVAPVVELDGVCHLFLVAEEKKGGALRYEDLPDDAKQVVKNRFFDEQEQDLYRGWIDALKQKAKIERPGS